MMKVRNNNKIIIYRLGSLGDTIVSLPCFHKIADRFPDAQRIVLTNRPVSPAAPRLADILQDSGLIHETVEYELNLRSSGDFIRLWSRLRRIGAGTLVYLAAPRGRMKLLRDLVFFWACGVRQIIGAPYTADLQQNRIDPQTGEEEFECERLARCLAELGPLDLSDRSLWDLRLTEAERDRSSRLLRVLGGKPFIAVNMGGKAVENDWGEANWSLLVGRLAKEIENLCVVIVGGAVDSNRAQTFAADKDGTFINLCGQLTPRETAAVLSRAALFVGHDSGPMHLAAACGVACIGLFGNRHRPHKWHPYGERSFVLRTGGPIAELTVDRVFEAVIGAMIAATDNISKTGQPAAGEGSVKSIDVP